MQFPQQRPRGDGRIHEEHTRQASPTEIQLDTEPEASRGAEEGPLLALYPATCVFVDRRLATAVFPARDDVVQAEIQRR
jgi:hypothetical protein